MTQTARQCERQWQKKSKVLLCFLFVQAEDVNALCVNSECKCRQEMQWNTVALECQVSKINVMVLWQNCNFFLPGQRFTFHENRFSSMLTVVIGLATTLRAASSKIYWKQKTSTKGDTRTPQRSVISLWTSPALTLSLWVSWAQFLENFVNFMATDTGQLGNWGGRALSVKTTQVLLANDTQIGDICYSYANLCIWSFFIFPFYHPDNREILCSCVIGAYLLRRSLPSKYTLPVPTNRTQDPEEALEGSLLSFFSMNKTDFHPITPPELIPSMVEDDKGEPGRGMKHYLREAFCRSVEPFSEVFDTKTKPRFEDGLGTTWMKDPTPTYFMNYDDRINRPSKCWRWVHNIQLMFHCDSWDHWRLKYTGVQS